MRHDLQDWIERYDLGDHEFLVVREALRGTENWIAGGAVRAFLQNRPIDTDVDVFFQNEQAYRDFVAEHAPPGTPEQKFHTTFQKKIGEKEYTVQAVKIAFFKDIEDTLDSFDYTICQFGVYGSGLFSGEYSLWDLARKRLAVHKITYGAASVRRMLKYSKQGFTACQGCIASLLEAVAANPDVIQAGVSYVD